MASMADMGAIIIGSVTATVAVWGIFTQRVIHRRRATLELIAKSDSDADIIAARKKFIELVKTEGSLLKYSEKDNEKTEEAQTFKLVLNEFELLAVGIRKGIIDYTIYKMYKRSMTVTYWNHSSSFIEALRRRLNNDKIYENFEILVQWLNAKRTPRLSYFWGQWF